MSVRRACEPCRALKAKCDLAQPTCGRCAKRKVDCSYAGGLREREFIFRDHNEFAQRKSEIARGTRRSPAASPPNASPPNNSPPNNSPPNNSPPNNSPPSNSPPQEEIPPVAEGLQPQQEDFAWLNELGRSEVPVSLRRNLEQRTIDRFFVDWVLLPCNLGSSPGYMKELPALYLTAEEDGVLKCAVEAMAFAAQRNERDAEGTLFSTKAQHRYGAALAKMQKVVTAEEGDFANDWTLGALLLIENFEMMYLSRSGYVTAHRSAVKQFVLARGMQPIFLRDSHGIWRTAHHRLQAYQILIGEPPEIPQMAWVDRLQTERPDLRISSDILRMNVLCAHARVAIEESDEDRTHLVQSISELLANIDDWTTKVNGIWRPRRSDTYDLLTQELQALTLSDILNPYPDGTGPTTSQDIWLTYMWNFHFASQIALRESLIDLLSTSSLPQDVARIAFEQEVIRVLAGNIIASFQALLSYSGDNGAAYVQAHGRSVARFFVVLSIWNLQNSKWTPEGYKRVTREVSEFVTEGQRLV